MRLKIVDPIINYLLAFWQLLNGTRLADEIRISANRQRDLFGILDFSHRLRILDLANGKLQPQFLLLRSLAHQVIGIDLVNNPLSVVEKNIYHIARWIYSWGIKQKTPWSSPSALICGDVGYLPFKDNYFDLVTSVAAFEHFLDVPRVVSEIHRVLRPGGAAYISIHQFTSLSGAHNIKLMENPIRSLPSNVEAWDHLRKQHIPVRVPLNKWRIPQYLNVFEQKFTVIKASCVMREGEHLLTPDIEAELNHYSKDELTCRSYVIVALKKSGSVVGK